MKKATYFILLASIGSVNAFAQDKLSNEQEESVWAAEPVKTDGELTEINDDFEAYNKRVLSYYTLSNDDEYLYLQLKSDDATNIAKIRAGGITFALNTDNKKKEDNAFTITYPVIKPQSMSGGRGGLAAFGIGGAEPDSAALAEAHKQFISSSKEIGVSGFKDISDSLISIYNEHSIKAAIGFTPAGDFTYELAIPLERLGLTPDEGTTISYNIKMNGLQMPARNNNRLLNSNGRGGGGGFRGGRGGGFGGGGGAPRGNINFAELISPTDFWASYTLANK